MRIVDRFSFAGAEDLLKSEHPDELREVEEAIAAIDGESCYVKVSYERGRGVLFSPIAFNHCLLHRQLHPNGWLSPERNLSISREFPATGLRRRIRLSVDGIKNFVGLECQLGKYSFLEYDVLAKMPIYQGRGLITVGIEIVPCFRLSRDMSSGVGDFERLVTNLAHRGDRPGDCPVLIIGFDIDLPDTPRPAHVVSFDASVPTKLKGNRPGPGKPDREPR